MVVVGAGPACGGHPVQAAQRAGAEVSVVSSRRARARRAHPQRRGDGPEALMAELFPDWKGKGAPLNQPVSGDDVPDPASRAQTARPISCAECMDNQGNYVISLGNGDQSGWASRPKALASRSSPLRFAAEVLYDDKGRGARRGTGNLGSRDGELRTDPTSSPAWNPGRSTRCSPRARAARLGKQPIAVHLPTTGATRRATPSASRNLEIEPVAPQQGRVVHTAGLADDNDTHGGGFLYHHLEGNKVTVGLPSAWTTRTRICPLRGNAALEDASRPSAPHRRRQAPGYGARAITTPAASRLPEAGVSGGALIGCACRFPQCQPHQAGSHAAMKTGMLAAESRTRRWPPAQRRRAERLPDRRSRRAGCTRSCNARATVVQEGLGARLMTGIE